MQLQWHLLIHVHRILVATAVHVNRMELEVSCVCARWDSQDTVVKFVSLIELFNGK